MINTTTRRVQLACKQPLNQPRMHVLHLPRGGFRPSIGLRRNRPRGRQQWWPSRAHPLLHAHRWRFVALDRSSRRSSIPRRRGTRSRMNKCPAHGNESRNKVRSTVTHSTHKQISLCWERGNGGVYIYIHVSFTRRKLINLPTTWCGQDLFVFLPTLS